MALQTRHRWMTSTVASAFGREDDEIAVEDVFKEQIQKVNGFLSGTSESNYMFVYFQKLEGITAHGEPVEKPGDAKYIITDGTDVRLKNKAAYFIRNVPAGKQVNLNNASDNELLFGEISASPLDSLDSSLSCLFLPMMQASSFDTEWGSCHEEQKEEFLTSFEKFCGDLSEAIQSLSGGIELRKLRDTYKNNPDIVAQNFHAAAQNSDLVSHFEDLLEEWCRQIEKSMEETAEGRKEPEKEGPRTELDYWRMRMQKLTSIIEQLKAKECKVVFAVLHAVTKVSAEAAPQSRQSVFNVLRRWKQIDIAITEAFNEARDNVKYLSTLEKFIEPLYTGTPASVVDNLNALMNAVKMIHTIARYYNTTERMTALLTKITNQMIACCKKTLLNGETPDKLWEADPEELIQQLHSCLTLNEAYQEQYRVTKDKLLTLPKGKQFDFSDTQIFGRFDLFCRRVVKLIDMFSTIQQFQSLSQHRFEGMETLVDAFRTIMEEFKSKRHDLLDFHSNRFDRDYVEFNVRISDLEAALQQFINQSFESIQSIEASLALLRKFQAILSRDNLKQDLQSKFTVIFHNYGLELQQVREQYEKYKLSPPVVRNLPPIAGNITWSRHLLKRIEDPMKKFLLHPHVLSTKDAKKIIRMYNKMAKTLVEFEIRWYQAWEDSIEASKAGLLATLIVRHPDDGKLYVNFDWEILQLIRETKCLDRLGVAIPETAKIVLLQELKFKAYHNELAYILKEYRRITAMIRPIASQLLKPHLDNLEFILRPGMTSLTWTSMNIDVYLNSVSLGLHKLEQLVVSCTDIMENRIDANLKTVSKLTLIKLPEADSSVSLDDFVRLQEEHVKEMTTNMIAKSLEVETAVEDLLAIIAGFPLDSHVPPVSDQEILKLRGHYSWALYQALLQATKSSLFLLKKRLQVRAAAVPDKDRPEVSDGEEEDNKADAQAFFEVDIQLDGTSVRLSPSIDAVQDAVNKAALALLKCSKNVRAWDTHTIPRAVIAARKGVDVIHLPADAASPAKRGPSFYDRIAQDKEILKVLLLLTGSVQSARTESSRYLDTFEDYHWLWRDSVQETYSAFAASKPSLDDFEKELRRFQRVGERLGLLEASKVVGALKLNTASLTKAFQDLANEWMGQYSAELHSQAKAKLEAITDTIREFQKRVQREVGAGDIDALRSVMDTLTAVRKKQSEIEFEFGPIEAMYSILDDYQRVGKDQTIDKDEADQRSMLRSSWRQLLGEAEERKEKLTGQQVDYKKDLISAINIFRKDVKAFREDYEKNGPMVHGIKPRDAVERLKRFKDEYDVRARKKDIYHAGEHLFGLVHQLYPELEKTKKEIEWLQQLYNLYVEVIDTIKEWKEYLWTEVPGQIEMMRTRVDQFSGQCKKLPKGLKDWEAYAELKKEIDDFYEVLPLLEELSKKSIMPRHWKQVEELTGKELPVESEMFKLQSLIDANLLAFRDEVSDICDGADKQLKIEGQKDEIAEKWKTAMFEFQKWKTRDYDCCLKGQSVADIQEGLEESQMALNTMNAQRHVAPFKEEVVNLLATLSDVSDTIERWTKVQMLWTSLESVFTGGDIAKQMPAEAKKFQKIDKDWIKIMTKAADTRLVIECCQNDLLKQLLPSLQADLEDCQKSLESYLEGKRNKFPRFYFVSNPVLLKILSQGSDPDQVQDDFEKLFDAISRVQFDKKDSKKIIKIKEVGGVNIEEVVDLSTPVKAEGNIEDWLGSLEREMQRSIRRECRNCALDSGSVYNGGLTLKEFNDKYPSQVSLLGIQLIWTADFQEALEKMSREKDKTIMSTVNKKFIQIMNDLTALCLSDLGNKMNRRKVETLVTIHVHQRELFTDIWKKTRDNRVKDHNDFEWLKQTRVYWKTDVDHALISIADVDFTYSYEYLGVKERLAITPLTDRCYLTNSQALGMYFGGAPAGPAGTGKTETVKDMGRTVGVFVVVTNCSDQHRYKDMAKIFKGLCQSGLWGCFDEFNRIDLEVLSVVAMQVESITQAKKQGAKTFMFPGEVAPITLIPSVAYFITMNPGYAGRQELPENLKVQFRSVSMMVPDRQIIMKVKLASVGFTDMEVLGKKFKVLYGLCEEQLSKQRHYDFGLRNILSVLRTAGTVKRQEPPDFDEELLLMRTLRDMNLSKLVADDVPLFLSLLKDIFPKQADPPKKVYKEVEEAVKEYVKQHSLIFHDSWILKVIQLYETSLVRHGFMLVGPTLCGKTEIMTVLTQALTEIGTKTVPYTMNPKAITAQEMYGVKDPISDEWTPGVFASIWQKQNNRNNKHNSWIVCDGPVDAIWIENLNTVLDDNKILTLANNDRIPMIDSCRIVFEVQDLNNASPATVSRAGIIYVSASDLGWEPLLERWLNSRKEQGSKGAEEAEILREYMTKYMKDADIFDFLMRNTKAVMPVSDAIMAMQVLNLLTGLLSDFQGELLAKEQYERFVTNAIVWGCGGLFEPEDRVKLNGFLKDKAKTSYPCAEGTTLFEYSVSPETKEWFMWKAEEWKAPKGKLQPSSILIPTLDSMRAEYLMTTSIKVPVQRTPTTSYKSVCLVGGTGTAKTSTALMFCSHFSIDTMLMKRANFSSATSPGMFQKTVEAEVERKTGKTYCPPGGKKMTFFLDDMSMPHVNEWGDQITLELGRQLIEQKGVYFLDKDKRGDFKTILDLLFIGAMNHPGGGRNDIPNRFKSKFFLFNMILPSITSVDNIYGSMIKARFSQKGASPKVLDIAKKLTDATIKIWDRVKKSLLPTPSRFHYVFNMRELSRIFTGIVLTPLEVLDSEERIVSLWKHECVRVLADKLSRQQDKDFVDNALLEVASEKFGDRLSATIKEEQLWADFLRDGEENDEEEIILPKIYEQAATLDQVRTKAQEFLKKYNEENQSKQMNLVLFNDAMGHLMRISRIIQMPRGSAMLVGVGGSGKQSLTRLAGYIAGSRRFQITITKTYNDNSLFEDLKGLYVSAGQKGESTVFIFTDQEVKNESFLEYFNSILATGELAGLFQKDEKDSMAAEVRNDFIKERPGLEENMINLYGYFLDRLRDNLHFVLCFSPVGSKFAVRAQKFPAVFSSVTIDWFLPWPEDALVAVSSEFMSAYRVDASEENKKGLYKLMGSCQDLVGQVCEIYFQRMRKQVYVTPKTYLSFIDFYKIVYEDKYVEVNQLERSVNVGLQKLNEAAKDVEAMKINLREEEKKLKESEEQTNKLLVKVQSETAKAEKKSAEVGVQRDECLADKAQIENEQEEANKDLQKAMPFLHEAESAAKSITPKDITELKTMKTPSDIIRLVFDGVLILFQKKVVDIRSEPKVLNKQEVGFFHDSFDEYAKAMLSDIRFLPDLFDFSANEKDNINDETCEFIEAYLTLENFNPAVAKKASSAAEGLCKWVSAMRMYHEAAKIVKPKLDFLNIQTARLNKALEALAAAEDELAKAQAVLDELNRQFQAAMDSKNALEEKAMATKRKMEQANKLINGLAGEKARWTEDSNNFAQRRQRLVGDVCLAAAFVSYCGPFNSEFREKLNIDYFFKTCQGMRIPVSEKIDMISFLVDEGTKGEWNLEGLPADDLSIQNGIMVTRSSRYPLMVDPQGQALAWIKKREAARMEGSPLGCITSLTNPRLKDQLEFCLQEGRPLIIEGVESEMDPMLDPVLEKQIIKKGKNLYIIVSDTQMDYNPEFFLYITSRLANPSFSPELQAKCAVIDFTVTLKGLEQQLLGRVLSMEQKSLEESLNQLIEDVTANTKSLQILDKQLLERLSNSSGNLLDDTELIEVLANTKAKATEVSIKLKDAAEKKVEIEEKREQYRPVATRGSVLYFCMTEVSLILWMYNSSLVQFLEQFDLSVQRSEKAQPTQKRVEKIVDYLTYQIYRYVNRGLFERHKRTFVLMIAIKIMIVSGSLTSGDVGVLLKAGGGLDEKSERQNPFKWFGSDAKVWLNVLQLSRHNFGGQQPAFFRDLPDSIARNEQAWRKWFEENEPENCQVPDYEDRLAMDKTLGHFIRLCLVRAFREDRTQVATGIFLNECLGTAFTDPVTDTIEEIHQESRAKTPVLFLLSPGADPTLSIDELAKKKKKFPTDKVSMGEGQEVPARDKMKNGFVTGSWVILQNCHLGLGFMAEIEVMLQKITEIDEDFRVWITCEPHNKFPIGLLQSAIKVTNEPPMGMKAGLARTYTTMVTQEMLDKIDDPKWRMAIYGTAFMHSIVQERRKFGPLGWCIPYEFNYSDLDASLLFLEKHLSTTVAVGQPLSWLTIQYMIAEVQYGGRITDDLDRELFITYASKYLNDELFKPTFTFNTPTPGAGAAGQTEFMYKVPDGAEIAIYKEFLSKLPPVDSPSVFGLHVNADLTFRVKESQSMLDTIMETQPKDSGGGGGKSREDQIKDKCQELLSKMPEDYIEEIYREQIKKLKGPSGLPERGFAVPLNIFLFQEIQRMQRIIGIVRTNCSSMIDAIDGTVIMTPELQLDMDAFFDLRVPKRWTHDPSGAEISWLTPNLGKWFTGLTERVTQLSDWLNTGRPKSYWLTGFFNPQGFLTAMRQEVTRQHKKDQWALDDVVLHSEVRSHDKDKIKDAPEEGVNIHGLFIEGARWHLHEGRLEESRPRQAVDVMPVMYLTAVDGKDKKKAGDYGQGPYDCPVYKYPKRNDRYLIFRSLLKTGEQTAMHWKLRGVALLCTPE